MSKCPTYGQIKQRRRGNRKPNDQMTKRSKEKEMNTVDFEEYQKAKNEIIGGVEYKEHSRQEQDGRIIKSYISEKNEVFHEVMTDGVVEFWSDKHSESRYYDNRTTEEIIAQYEDKIDALENENRELIERLQVAEENLKDANKELEEANDTISDLKDKFSEIENIAAGV